MAEGYGEDFWGRSKTSPWWNQDASDAGQGLYSDPNLAIQLATLPKQIVAAQEQYDQAAQEARQSRGGFMSQLMGNLQSFGHGLDGVLSHVPGWGVAKTSIKTAWWPVDKLASGAYWLYSEGVSQPLSTLILQSAKAEISGDWGTLLSGDEWAKSYHKAEHLSPAQAFANYENTVAAKGDPGAFAGVFASGVDNMSGKERDEVARAGDRFLYDTDYWRDKNGWKYTVGTGSLDFMFSMGLDPAYAGVSAVSKVVKGGRAVKIEGAAAEPIRGGSAFNKAGGRIGTALAPKAKTAEQATQSSKVNSFFDWADGKSAAEIAQHPIWGRGRRINPARNQLSSLLSNTSRDDMPLLLRFAAGDNNAAAALAGRSEDTLIQLGKMEDNRVLVDSVKFDSDLLQHFMQQERAGLGGAGRPGVAGESTGYLEGRLVEPPYPRPTEPGPRQDGWDATYGHLAETSKIYRQAAGDILKGLNGVRPMGGAAGTASADMLRATEWKAGQLDAMERQIAALQEKSTYYGGVLGNLGKGAEDFSPGESNIFGTVKSLYRQGPLAFRSSEKAAEKNIQRLGAGRGDKLRKGDAGFVTRLVRNGFYTPAVRLVQSFGERVPEGFIDHGADDAFERVADMLKQVPGLGAETRLNMVNEYSGAGDKIARSKVLENIHTNVIRHMAENVKGLDPQTALIINEMRRDGFSKTMTKLTGKANPAQRFSGAEDQLTGRMVDHVEDGEGYVVSPLAKTQLQNAEPLLPVREFDRLLSRNSGYLKTLRKAGGSALDNTKAVADSFNTMWKAATLLRPGYVLRSMSEEQVASAVKFGMASSVIGAGKGGVNWALNRAQHVGAIVGKASYTPTTGGGAAKAILKISDEAQVAKAKALGLPTERVRISNAWPVVQARISEERMALDDVEKELSQLRERPDAPPELIDDLMNKAADHREVIGEHQDYATALLQEAKLSSGRRLGEGEFEHEGITIPQAFSKAWDNPIPRDQITSAHAMETIFARGEAIDNGRIIKTGSWKAITPDEPQHMQSWLDGLNKQFRQDELFRLVAQDGSLKAARSWLKTPAGRYHLSLLGPRARDSEGTLRAIKQTLDQYLPEGTGLQQKLARNEEITEHELRGAISADDFPQVHGEELKALTAMFSKQTASRVVDDMIEKGFNRLATIPNDVMARQPIYLRAQEARMRDLISQEVGYRRAAGVDESLDMKTMNKILEKSDKLARKDISQIVYDPTRTTATEALRFLTPFLSAHVDGLQRWGGLIAEKPQFLATAAKIYNAPVAANMVTDQYGRHVDQNGYVEIRDPETGKVTGKQFVPLEKRVLTLRMPGDTKNVKGLGEVPTGGIPISLSALNTILPGDPWFNPGSGPYVQMAASQVAKAHPGVGDFLQWAKVLPYGPSENWYDAALPKYMRDAWDAFTAGDEGNTAYQQAYLAEYQRQMGEYANGGDAPDMKEVEKNAKRFMYLQAFTAWASPTQTKETPLTKSPYQFFVDQYKVMQEVDPKNAQALFMQKYGKDYFAFTASLSKSMGIASTVSAENTASMYKDLIARDPDMASLIVGDVYNKGNFSSSVYRKQMDELIGGERVRQKMTAEQAIKENQKDAGWQQYNKYMTMLDSAMIRAGFTSYNQSGAEALSAVKRQLTDIVASGNDAWAEDYGNVQMNKIPMRIDAMKRITSDERLMSDPMRSDLAVLKLYLNARDGLKAALNARGAQKLSFGVNDIPIGKNADIGQALNQMQLYFVNADTRFGDIFHRYLDRDDLS